MTFLKWLLGLDWPEDVDRRLAEIEGSLEQMFERLDLLERWVKNLDEALWTVEQAQRRREAPELRLPQSVKVEPEPGIAGLKDLADKIRSEMMAMKKPFPTSKDGLR